MCVVGVVFKGIISGEILVPRKNLPPPPIKDTSTRRCECVTEFFERWVGLSRFFIGSKRNLNKIAMGFF